VTERAKREIERLIDECSEDEKRAIFEYLKARVPQKQHPLETEWGISGDVILSAIARSSDLTRRGVRGVIAEAVFESHILPFASEWRSLTFTGDESYDFLLANEADPPRQIRIQVKLQRMAAHEPMSAQKGNRLYPPDQFTVEVQKTRGGTDPSTNESTRPYHFGEFDILAVSMHPSTHEWSRFMFTLGDWLVARRDDARLIEEFQPVPRTPTDCWTDRLSTCIEWFLRGEKRRIFDLEAAALVHNAGKKQ
jgi:hypothetical protein